MSERYGYIRVSSRDQNEARQRIAMKELEIPETNIYMDRQSGKDFDRPQYLELTACMKEEDVLYVMSIDRGRDMKVWESMIFPTGAMRKLLMMTAGW